jgi:hypothetical protein
MGLGAPKFVTPRLTNLEAECRGECELRSSVLRNCAPQIAAYDHDFVLCAPVPAAEAPLHTKLSFGPRKLRSDIRVFFASPRRWLRMDPSSNKEPEDR